MQRGRSVTGTCRSARQSFLHITFLSRLIQNTCNGFVFAHVFPFVCPNKSCTLIHLPSSSSPDPWKPSSYPSTPSPRQVNPASSHFDPTRGTGAQPGCSRQRADREKEVEKDVHALTYVLSIEIALTVTVLCREASREKRG